MAALAYDEPRRGALPARLPNDLPASELKLLTIDPRGAVRCLNVPLTGHHGRWDATAEPFLQTMTWLETSKSVWLTAASAKGRGQFED